jgi:hypothetical protein
LADLKISEATLISSASGVLQGTDRFPFARQSSSTAYSVNLAFIYSTMMDWLDGIASNPLDGTAGDEPKAIYFRAGDAFSGTEGDGAGITIRAGAADGDGGGGPITILAGNAGGELAAGALDLQGGTGAGTASSEISLPGGQPIGDVTPTLTIQGGNAHNATNNAGTSIEIIAGSGDGTGVGGHAWFYSNPISTGTSGEAAVFSGNTTVSGDTGVASIGSGSAEGSGGDSGAVVVYTGDSVAADTGAISITTGTAAHFSGDVTIVTGPGNTKSGNTFLQTGKSDSGDSGNITIQTGTAGGTRGDIVLDAPAITSTAAEVDFSSDIVLGTDAGEIDLQGATKVQVYTLNSFGNSGSAVVSTGNSASGDSGDITIRTGTASGTRGDIVLDAPRVICSHGLTFLSDTFASGQPFEIGSLGHTSESAATGNVDVFSGDITSDSQPTGSVSIGSGFVTGAAHSGLAQIYTGDSSGGNSGDIQLVTGTADSGTRGKVSAVAREISLVADEKIILDAGYLICPVGNNFLELGTEGTGGVDVFTGSLTGDQVSGGTNISTGNTENAHTGGLQIFSGSASGAGYNSGSIGIYTGNPGEGGTRGKIVLDALRVLLVGAPTSDPHDAGALWVDTSADNVVKCSAG